MSTGVTVFRKASVVEIVSMSYLLFGNKEAKTVLGVKKVMK